MTGRIDLNADLGESFGRWTLGDDAALLPLISSANVACGFHAGDPLTLRRTVSGAAEIGVTVGAQVGYRDLAGFGRRFLDIAPEELTAEIIYQIGALDGLCRAVRRIEDSSAGAPEGTATRFAVRYVKPHGALYNTIVHHEAQAAAVVAAVRDYDPLLPVLGLPGSAFLRLAERAGLRVVAEAFADRGYRPDGTLVPRSESGALLDDPEQVAARVVRIAERGEIVAVDGSVIPAPAESVCLHGDSPAAVRLAGAVRIALESAGIAVTPFAGPAVPVTSRNLEARSPQLRHQQP